MPTPLLLLAVLSFSLAGGLVATCAARRPSCRREAPSPVDLRVEGWLACEAVVAREAPELLARVRTSVPAALRLAYEEHEERARLERFLAAAWRQPRPRRSRLRRVLSRRAAD